VVADLDHRGQQVQPDLRDLPEQLDHKDLPDLQVLRVFKVQPDLRDLPEKPDHKDLPDLQVLLVFKDQQVL
jgi:hypothetical protein